MTSSRKPVDGRSFELAGKSIAPGERLQFGLPTASLYTNDPLDMPVEVVQGRAAGPVLLVCGGIHGDELNGVEIIRRLRTLRALNRIAGTLILVPVVNLFGFIHQSRYFPDRRDLNRCFPGSESGSLASRVAHVFFSEIVARSTHIIDLHTGAVNRDNLPQVRADLANPNISAMAHGFSIPVIINSGGGDNTLRYEAAQRGIPTITYESGEALRLDERCVVTGVRGITSVMRELKMLPAGRRRAIHSEPYIATASRWFRAPSDGMFRPLVKLGSRVAKGDTLGVIALPFSPHEELLTAPNDGIVICSHKLPLVNEGDALFHIAQFEAEAAVEEEIAEHQSHIVDDRLYEIDVTSETSPS